MIDESAFIGLTGWPNLLLAYRKASKGKRGTMAIAVFEARLEDNLITLQEQLRSGVWRPGGYVSFHIHDPKRRLISAAPFADRVVHHALCTIIEPDFERSFVDESFANRLGKGNHRALNHAQDCARRFAYVLPLDIRKFFPSIDHAILRAVLARKICDNKIMGLSDRILESGRGIHDEVYEPCLFPGDDPLSPARPRGLPIGNLTSQFWANVYMNPLDHFIKRELGCRGYVRYVDDLLLFAHAKRILWQWKARIEGRLCALRLLIHPGAHPRPVAEGFGFLGFRIEPGRRTLKKRKGIQYHQRLKAMVAAYNGGEVAAESLLESILAWNNHAGYGNTVGLRKAIFGCLPAEIAGEARKRYRRTLKRREQSGERRG